MAAVDRASGDRGQVKIDPLGGSAVQVVASMNKWTASFAKEMYKATAFGDTNQIYSPGLPDVGGSLGAFWDPTDRTLFSIALGTVAPFMHLIPNTLTPTFLWKGLAWLDAGIEVGQGGMVTVSGNWKAAGNWSMLP